MHLTNWAINKRNAVSSEEGTPIVPNVGSIKRPIASVRNWLDANGHSSADVWGDVERLAVKTIIAGKPSLAHRYEL
jgi:hypothetical protein